MAKKRCEYEDNRGRCRRLGVGQPALCSDHEEVEFESESEYAPIIETVLQNPRVYKIVSKAGGILDALAGLIDRATQKVTEGPRPVSEAPGGARRPVRSVPKDDPRTVLHFGPKDVLTEEIIKLRRRDLAKIAHPDKPGGSDEAMRKINAAADALLKMVK
mgnify:CR=1 FL=1